MSKLLTLFRRAPKRVSTVIAILAAAIIVPAALSAYGPERPTYTYERPADHVTFNSITNNPKVGDERNFVRIKEASTTTTYGKNVTLQPGKTYQVEVYYHNNAASDLNASGAGIAKDVTLRMQMPGVVNPNSNATISGFINSSNATPTSVWDSSTATNASGATYALSYVPNSAKVSSNGAVNGKTLPNSLFTTGTNLGYDSLNGILPGCNQYAGYVTYEFTVDQPNFTVAKQVSVDAGKTWGTTASAAPGSTIMYRVIYTNTGTTQQDNVTLSDTLPKGVTYVPGSSLIANSKTGGSYKATVDGITSNGYNIGSYAPAGGNAYVKFSATVPKNDDLAVCGINTLQNIARATTSGGYKEAFADVTITKECQPPVAAYTCDALTVTRIERTKFRFTTDYTVKNATFKNITYVIRDESGKEVERQTSAVKTLDYTRTIVGKYTVEAIVTVSVNGQDKTVTDVNCKKAFEVPATPDYCTIPGKENLPKNSPECVETPVPPVTPSELPRTGAGSNIAAFIGLGSLIASMTYYVRSRRLGSNL